MTEHYHKRNIFIEELAHHIKFTIGAVLLASFIIVILKYTIFKPTAYAEPQHLFEGFFIAHLFFASVTPAALFSIYNRNLILGITIAILSSSVTCSLSDIFFPYLGGLLLQYDMDFHLCIIEEPVISWIFIVSGAFIGFFLSNYVSKLSRYTHATHIFLSSMAAGMYLITFGVGFLSLKALIFLPILIVSVLVPCVMNDIGVPSSVVTISNILGKSREEMLDTMHEEHHGHKH